MGELVSPMLVMIGTDVEEVVSVQAVGPGMCASTCLVAEGGFGSFFLHRFLLGWFGRQLVGEPAEPLPWRERAGLLRWSFG